jgi:NAD(P)H-dependent FMN reductase
LLELCALSGSLRAVSRNTALLRAAQLVAPAPIRIAIFDRLGEIPSFNPDIESIQPPAVSALKRSVAAIRELRGD